MSELKVHNFVSIDELHQDDLYTCSGLPYYLKSEADAVIEDITKGAMSMFREANRCRGLDTKSPLGRIADVAFKHWNRVEHTMSNNRQLRLDKANLLRSNEYLRTQLNSEMSRRITDKLEYDLNVRHSNHKRCLAMAQWCMDAECKTEKDADFLVRWEHRWLALAEEPTWAKFLQLIHKEVDK